METRANGTESSENEKLTSLLAGCDRARDDEQAKESEKFPRHVSRAFNVSTVDTTYSTTLYSLPVSVFIVRVSITFHIFR